jgi:tetratricopeptide (TPR) repeat protein
MPHDVFISYSSIDKAAAFAACATFEAAQIRCWIAPRDVAAGAEWAEEIINAIERAKVMVLIFSSNSNESRQVRREVELAVSRGITIMPVRLEKTDPTRSMAYYMAGVHWIDALTPPLERHLKAVVGWIKPHLESGGPIPEMEVPPPPTKKAPPKDAKPPPPRQEPPKPDARPERRPVPAKPQRRSSSIFSDLLYEFFGIGVKEGGLRIGEAARAIDAAVKLQRSGRIDEAIAAYLALIERIEAAPAPSLDLNLAIATFNLGVMYASKGQLQDAVNAYRDVVRRCGDIKDALIEPKVAMAINNQAATLVDLGRAKEAIPLYDDLIDRYPETYDTEINEQLAIARYGRGVAFGALGRSAEAIAAYDEAIAKIDVRVYPALDEYVAMSMCNKGTRLNAMGRNNEALAVFEQVVSRFGTSKKAGEREQVAKALTNSASILIDSKRYDEGLALCDRILAGPRDTPGLTQLAAMAMRNKVVALKGGGRNKEAAAVADRMLGEFGTSTDSAISAQVGIVRQIRTTL